MEEYDFEDLILNPFKSDPLNIDGEINSYLNGEQLDFNLNDDDLLNNYLDLQDEHDILNRKSMDQFDSIQAEDHNDIQDHGSDEIIFEDLIEEIIDTNAESNDVHVDTSIIKNKFQSINH